jgi:uncharacterized protein YjiS (DUF1127 family)
METQMSNVNDLHPSRDHLVDRSHAGFGQAIGFVKALAKRRQRRRELNHLLVLPDYLLKDIGVTRGQIERELAERAS